MKNLDPTRVRTQIEALDAKRRELLAAQSQAETVIAALDATWLPLAKSGLFVSDFSKAWGTVELIADYMAKGVRNPSSHLCRVAHTKYIETKDGAYSGWFRRNAKGKDVPNVQRLNRYKVVAKADFAKLPKIEVTDKDGAHVVTSWRELQKYGVTVVDAADAVRPSKKVAPSSVGRLKAAIAKLSLVDAQTVGCFVASRISHLLTTDNIKPSPEKVLEYMTPSIFFILSPPETTPAEVLAQPAQMPAKTSRKTA